MEVFGNKMVTREALELYKDKFVEYDVVWLGGNMFQTDSTNFEKEMCHQLDMAVGVGESALL